MKKLPILQKQAYLFTDPLTCEYLTGLKFAEGVLVYSHSPAYLVDARYFSAAKPLIEQNGLTAVLYKGQESLLELLKSQKVKTLFIDFDKVTLSQYKEYKKLGVKLLDGSLAIKQARSVKETSEIDSIKKACAIAQKAMQNIVKDIKKGVSENFIKEKLESDMLSMGARGTSFETIVAFGTHSAVPHHQTGETLLEDNSVVLIDMGCKVNGYCSDITRTFFFGQPTPKFIDCYNAVLSANLTAIENIKSGVRTDVADAFARNLLKEKGLAENFTHSLGHGVGLEIHEFPSLSPKKSDELLNNMVFTIEPGVYFDGEFGIRIEDTVLLENGKVERLYTDQKELKIIK